MPSDFLPSARFLVVDDEVDLCMLYQTALQRAGYEVITANSVAQARHILETAGGFTGVLSDMRLGDSPEESGLALNRYVQDNFIGMPVSIMTAYGSTQSAVEALKAGAFDYLTKPVSISQLRELAANMVAQASVAKHQVPARIIEAAKRDNAEDGAVATLISGDSAAMRAVQTQITQLSRTQSPVVLEGESGTGKELAARALHQLGARAPHAFIAINCGAIPETLIEAELFGVKKGAFTGATADRDGVFHAAHQGTLLLDEIGDLPLNMQVKLLRVLQEKSVRRVGSTAEEPIDVRIIAASHKSLSTLVADGAFRQDLYYRLNVMQVVLPPLRDRGTDAVLLAQAYLNRTRPELALRIGESAQTWLCDYAYPGNVRELENLMERCMALCEAQGTQTIGVEMLGEGTQTPKPSPIRNLDQNLDQNQKSATTSNLNTNMTTPAANTISAAVSTLAAAQAAAHAAANRGLEFPIKLEEHLLTFEKNIIEAALLQSRYNKQATADLLGLNIRQLRYRLEILKIE